MKHLILLQRYALKAYLVCGKSKNQIDKLLGVCRSIIYRELKRNSRKTGCSNPDFAQELAEERKERFCKNRKFDGRKQNLVFKRLTEER